MYTRRRLGTCHRFGLQWSYRRLLIFDTLSRNVQVTFQILRALIEKLPRELPLYAPFILQILNTILRSKDLTMIEESVATFDTFCRHHDVATLAADQEHINQYEEIVRTYASYAALKTFSPPKGGLSASLALRWRTAGLQALKSITASEAVGADGGRQMNIIVPIILENLHSNDELHLLTLQQKAHAAESTEKEQAKRRRMSNATVRTTTEGGARPKSAITETADDADRLAEEEVGILAIQCLRQIYEVNSRGQIRLATGAVLKFICSGTLGKRSDSQKGAKPGNGTWSTALMEMITRWAPVQDRFVILVNVMETLVRSPVAEENLEQQLLLVSLVGWLLRSSINMIGLSIMDVLLGLVQHVLLLLQLGGSGSNVLPHHQQMNAIDLFAGTEDVIEGPKSASGEKDGVVVEESVPSSNRQELLVRMQRCIGDLAVHIYYSDQISDIIQAILLRLKPSPNVKTTADAIEHPQAAAEAISRSVNMQEDPKTDEFFSFGTARVTALKSVTEVLSVANARGSINGAAAIGRNRVGVQVWEGTQWLLRDEDRRVRRAYVDALLTWLRLEMSSNDLRVFEDKRKMIRTASKTDMTVNQRDVFTKRATSTASRGPKPGVPTKSTFLHLLHLAIYDNAVESPEAEDDLLLLHLLLYHLVEKLGVNAVKNGLPMMMRLQEDINLDVVFASPIAKLNIGTLCHGYFWTLSEKFDFDTSTAGYVIQSEIQRRKKHCLWLDTIQVPPLPLAQIMSATARPLSENASTTALQTESIKPFDARLEIVDRIAISYCNAIASPPSSPPASPGRVFSMPVLSTADPTSAPSSSSNELPSTIKETMLSEWSKEICIATVEKEVTRTSSLNGSRRGTNLSQLLAVNGLGNRGVSPNGTQTPRPGVSADEGNNMAFQPPAISLAFQNHGNSSANGSTSPNSVNSSEQNTTLRVDDLKKVLAGGTIKHLRNASPLRRSTSDHDVVEPQTRDKTRRSVSPSSESAVSADGFESASEGDLSRAVPAVRPRSLMAESVKEQPKPAPISITSRPTPPSSHHSRTTSSTHPRSRPHSGYSEPATPRSLRRPSTSSSAANEDPEVNAAALRGEMPRLSTEVKDEVPPVPPLPAGVSPAPRPLSGVGPGPGPISPVEGMNRVDGSQGGGVVPDEVLKAGSEDAEGGRRVSRSSPRKKGVDIAALLGSIDAVAGERRSRLGSGKPPY